MYISQIVKKTLHYVYTYVHTCVCTFSLSTRNDARITDCKKQTKKRKRQSKRKIPLDILESHDDSSDESVYFDCSSSILEEDEELDEFYDCQSFNETSETETETNESDEWKQVEKKTRCRTRSSSPKRISTNIGSPIISGHTMKITSHAKEQIRTKGFSESAIADTFENPERVYKSGSHKGQIRVAGNGLCLVGKITEVGHIDMKMKSNRSNGNSVFNIITVYEDMKLTPPRPDQMNTEAGRIYAERWRAGLGRSSQIRVA